MRGKVAVLAVVLGGLCGCWGPVDQGSQAPGAKIPAAARGAEAKKICKDNPDLDHPYCKQIKAAAASAPAAHH